MRLRSHHGGPEEANGHRLHGRHAAHCIAIDDESLVHLSPIGWEHVNLTGDYTWQAAGRVRKDAFRPLDPLQRKPVI
ncbi:MAG TPA: hypothetical protein VGM27_17265 [Acidobacteriaceae bacterium]